MDKLESYSAKNPIVCEVLQQCRQVRLCAQQLNQGSAPVEFPCPSGPEEAAKYDNPDSRYIYVNLDSSVADDPRYFYYPWAKYKQAQFVEYCDSEFKIPVGKVIAVRALLATLAILAIIWFIIDVVITRRANRCARIQDEKISSFDPKIAQEIHDRNLAELIWMNHGITSAPVSGASSLNGTPRAGMVSRVVTPLTSIDSPSPSYKVAVCANPYRAFQSTNWQKKLQRFNENFSPKVRQRSRIIYLSIPMLVIVVGSLLCLVFLALAPGDLVNTHSVADSILTGYSTIFRARATWIILPFLLLDELYETVLFLMEAVVVKWGTETIYSKYVTQAVINDSVSNFEDDDDNDYADEKVVSEQLIPDGVIAVMCIEGLRICDDEEFISNVNSVINVFGIERTFVLQFGDSLSPLDDTVVLLQQRIALGFQYIYVPERDTRSAIYWFSKYYIPLFQLHQDPMSVFAVTHLLIVDQSIAVPPTMAIPHEYVLEQEMTDFDSNQSESFVPLPGAICFASRHKGGFSNLDMQFEIMHASFLSDRFSLGETEIVQRSGVVVFERDALEFGAFNHVPITSSQGGDMVGIGRELGGRSVKFVHNNLINQPTKSSFFDKLFEVYAKQKRLFGLDILSLVSPKAVLDRNRMAEKPYVILKILHAIFDTIRWPVLIDSSLRDPFGVACIVGVFVLLLYLKVVVLWLVISRSPIAARVDRPTILTSILYPYYHFLWNLLILRPFSAIAALFWSILDKPDTSIAIREDYEQNIPPCLPYPDAPWYSVWRAQA
jgi:hypothetical protein